MPPSRRDFLATIGPLPPLALAETGGVLDALSGPPRSAGRLALVVGHTRLRPGAYGISPISEYEYPFNARLGTLIQERAKARNVEVRTFYRDLGGVATAYAEAATWGADAVVELHFNATSRFLDDIRGTETLAAGGERHSSYLLAETIQKASTRVLERPGLLDRGVKFTLLRDAYKIPAILTEPVFGNNREDARLLADRREPYAAALVQGFLDFQKIRSRPQELRPLPPVVSELPDHIRA